MNFDVLLNEYGTQLKPLDELITVVEFHNALAKELEVDKVSTLSLHNCPFSKSNSDIYTISSLVENKGERKINLLHRRGNKCGISSLYVNVTLEEVIPPVWSLVETLIYDIYEVSSGTEACIVDTCSGVSRYAQFNKKLDFKLFSDSTLTVYFYNEKVGYAVVKSDNSKYASIVVDEYTIKDYIDVFLKHSNSFSYRDDNDEEIVNKITFIRDNFKRFAFDLVNVVPNKYTEADRYIGEDYFDEDEDNDCNEDE